MIKEPQSSPEQRWTISVNAEGKSVNWSIRELLNYRYLLFMLVKKDLSYSFKQTVLGPIWIILNPIISTLIFALVFSFFAKVNTDNVPAILFYLTGGILYNYFANAFVSVSNALNSNKNILGKVYIPRIILPLASGVTPLVKFLLVFIVSTPVFIYYVGIGKANPSLWIYAIPFLLFLVFFISLGLGLIFSALMVRRRDLGVLLPFLTSIFTFVTPVFYPISLVPPYLQKIYLINPLAGIVECFRYSITGAGSFEPYMLVSSVVVTVVLFCTGLALFRKINDKIPDLI